MSLNVCLPPLATNPRSLPDRPLPAIASSRVNVSPSYIVSTIAAAVAGSPTTVDKFLAELQRDLLPLHNQDLAGWYMCTFIYISCRCYASGRVVFTNLAQTHFPIQSPHLHSHTAPPPPAHVLMLLLASLSSVSNLADLHARKKTETGNPSCPPVDMADYRYYQEQDLSDKYQVRVAAWLITGATRSST